MHERSGPRALPRRPPALQLGTSARCAQAHFAGPSITDWMACSMLAAIYRCVLRFELFARPFGLLVSHTASSGFCFIGLLGVSGHKTTRFSVSEMGRSKYLEPLTKNEKRRAQNGHTESKQKWHQTYKLTSGYRAPRTRTVIDTRVQSKTSNNSNWLHAVGFVVLAAIVIS